MYTKDKVIATLIIVTTMVLIGAWALGSFLFDKIYFEGQLSVFEGVASKGYVTMSRTDENGEEVVLMTLIDANRLELEDVSQGDDESDEKEDKEDEK